MTVQEGFDGAVPDESITGTVTVRRNYDDDTLTVLQADLLVAITPELWQMVLDGHLPHAEAGQGDFVIWARNGTWRYRLTGRQTVRGNFVMRLVSRPTAIRR